MTRTECENKILEKLEEIGEIAREFDPKAHHLSMYVIGKSACVACSDDETGEEILSRHNHKWDGEEGDNW